MISEREILIRIGTGCDISMDEIQSHLHQLSVAEKSELPRLEKHARRKFRDSSLLEAAEVLGADDPGAWRLAERLEMAVDRFESCVWPRLKRGGQAELLSPVDAALHRAFLTGETVPTSQRRIYALLLTRST